MKVAHRVEESRYINDLSSVRYHNIHVASLNSYRRYALSAPSSSQQGAAMTSACWSAGQELHIRVRSPFGVSRSIAVLWLVRFSTHKNCVMCRFDIF